MDMDEKLNHLLIIDWQLGLKLAGHRQELADEILGMLTNRLDSDLMLIKELSVKANYIALKDEIHKLHGAVCYCGTPRLKTILGVLETDLKNNIMTDLPYLIDRLNGEVVLVLEQYANHQKAISSL